MAVAVPLHEIIAELEDLDDPRDRQGYLIEIGRTLAPLPEELRTEENRVLGCQARVWLAAEERPGPSATLDLHADSDAHIVKGLIAVLLAAYSGHTPAEILAFPIEELFSRLKLPSLVPMRSNGLYAMVKRIQSIAREAGAEQAPAVGMPLVQVRLAPRAASSPPPAGSKPSGMRPAMKKPPGPGLVPAKENGSAARNRSQESPTQFDVEKIREDFPILATQLAPGVPLVYLDNGASTQRPRQVIEAIVEAYEHYYSNVHRGGHTLAAQSTAHYEAARESVRELINARSTTEIVFTSGTTAAINLVARSWGDANLRPGDEILLTLMEHHSNIVPWQQLAERTGAKIRWTPITDDYELDLQALDELITERTRIVAVTAVSNVLGTIVPIRAIVERAHVAGAVVLVDAAQAVPHEPIDVRAWDADFLAFSGHKMLGPSGVGVLYGREALLEAMPPFLGGGSMIKTVTQEGFTPADLPYKFEAGTPVIVPAIGLGRAVQYLQAIGLDQVRQQELRLTTLAQELLSEVPGLALIGPAPERKGGICSFVVEGAHPDDVSRALDLQGIAIRAGHHCALPLHERLGLSATCRASFYFYNTLQEVERLAEVLGTVRNLFR